MNNQPARTHIEEAILFVALVVTVIVALTGHVTLAVYLLAGLCAANAVTRLIRRGRPWNEGKKWQIDVAFYLLLAIGLVLLAPAARIPGP